MSCEGIVTGADVVTAVDGDDTTNSRGRYLSLVFPKLYTLVGVVFEALVEVGNVEGHSLPSGGYCAPWCCCCCR